MSERAPETQHRIMGASRCCSTLPACSTSSPRGRLTEPTTWPLANSPGERTSTTRGCAGLMGHRSSAAGLNAQLAQDALQHAPLGEAALQQVGAHEGGERQPPLADEDRAAGYAQRQAQQHEAAGDDAHELPRGHGGSPLKNDVAAGQRSTVLAQVARLEGALGPVEYARSEEHTSELQSPLNIVCRP